MSLGSFLSKPFIATPFPYLKVMTLPVLIPKFDVWSQVNCISSETLISNLKEQTLIRVNRALSLAKRTLRTFGCEYTKRYPAVVRFLEGADQVGTQCSCDQLSFLNWSGNHREDSVNPISKLPRFLPAILVIPL